MTLSVADELRVMSACIQEAAGYKFKRDVDEYAKAFIPCMISWLTEVYAAGGLPGGGHWDGWRKAAIEANDTLGLGYTFPDIGRKGHDAVLDIIKKKCKESTTLLAWEDVYQHATGGCECEHGAPPCTHTIRLVVHNIETTQGEASPDRMARLAECTIRHLINILTNVAQNGKMNLRGSWFELCYIVEDEPDARKFYIFYHHLDASARTTLEENVAKGLRAHGFGWAKEKNNVIHISF